MTGVLLVSGSLLLQAPNNIRLHAINKTFLTRRRNGATAKHVLCVSTAPWRRCGRNLFLDVIVDRCPLILFLRHRLTGHTILTLNPTAKVNKLTAF
jgi:hypothetical protein